MLSIIDSDFPQLVGYFENLVGKSRVQSMCSRASHKLPGKEHFWYRFIKTYRKWQRAGSRISDVTSNETLMRFGMLVENIRQFESDWNKDGIRDKVVKILADSKRAPKLLFEFRIGIHFRDRVDEVHWIPPFGKDKVPDLELLLVDCPKILVECTERDAPLGRSSWDQKIVEDLLSSASSKLESSYDWNYPRLIVVRIPEEIDWQQDEIRNEIQAKVNSWFRRLQHVNAIYFMGSDTIASLRNRRGRIDRYISDQRVFRFWNNQNPAIPLTPSVISLLDGAKVL